MLSQMTRVARPERVSPLVEDGVARRLLVPPERGSELALDELRLDPGASLDLTDDDAVRVAAATTCAGG